MSARLPAPSLMIETGTGDILFLNPLVDFPLIPVFINYTDQLLC